MGCIVYDKGTRRDCLLLFYLAMQILGAFSQTVSSRVKMLVNKPARVNAALYHRYLGTQVHILRKYLFRAPVLPCPKFDNTSSRS